MWHDRRQPYPRGTTTSRTRFLAAGWPALLFVACGLVWLIGQVAAILFGAHEHLPMPAGRHARGAAQPARHLGRPGQGLATLLLSSCCRARWACTPPPSSPSGFPPWPTGCWCGCSRHGPAASASSAAAPLGQPVAAPPPCRAGAAAGRIILGRRDRIRDRLLGRLYLAVKQCHSVLAFGPPGSLKTHGLVIPAILEWQGNLVTTSIKPDVLRATCAHRASLGAVWVYRPPRLERRAGGAVDAAGMLRQRRRRPPDRADARRGRRRPGPSRR